jgi:hypothetical protein
VRKSDYVLLAVICIVLAYQFIIKPANITLNNMARGNDAEESNKLGRHIEKQAVFTGKPATNSDDRWFYITPRRNAARITVYGMTNTEPQEQLLSAVKEWQTTNQHLAKLEVLFYEFRRRGDAPRNEGLLRHVTVDASTNQQSATPRN